MVSRCMPWCRSFFRSFSSKITWYLIMSSSCKTSRAESQPVGQTVPSHLVGCPSMPGPMRITRAIACWMARCDQGSRYEILKLRHITLHVTVFHMGWSRTPVVTLKPGLKPWSSREDFKDDFFEERVPSLPFTPRAMKGDSMGCSEECDLCPLQIWWPVGLGLYSDPSNLTPRMAGRLIHCGGLRGVPALGQAHDSQCWLRTREDMCPVGQRCGRVRENWVLRSYLRWWPRGLTIFPRGKAGGGFWMLRVQQGDQWLQD